MVVYVVFYQPNDTVLGIFSTEDNALEFRNTLRGNYEDSYHMEMEIDNP